MFGLISMPAFVKYVTEKLIPFSLRQASPSAKLWLCLCHHHQA